MFMEDESELLDNLLDIILKSYMQREHFIKSLCNLDLLSTQVDIDMHYKISPIKKDDYAFNFSDIHCFGASMTVIDGSTHLVNTIGRLQYHRP